MTQLSVNLNKVALIRNQRAGNVPDLAQAAQWCLEAGAIGITLHPRPDERHARYDDISRMQEIVKAYPGKEVNIEGNPGEGKWLDAVLELAPEQATLVPDAPGQNTSDHGVPLSQKTAEGVYWLKKLEPVVRDLQAKGCRVSVFIDPNPIHAEGAALLGVDRVELYTEGWADAYKAGGNTAVDALCQYADTAQAACENGLGVNAGHDLTLQNLPPFLSAVKGVSEVSIGQSLVADAMQWGLAATVKKYVAICQGIKDNG